jgi:hypothetical protein
MTNEDDTLESLQDVNAGTTDPLSQMCSMPERDANPMRAGSLEIRIETRLPAEKARGRKRSRLGDAMREAGLDEHKVAATYVDVVEKLRTANETDGSLEKILAGVLKECSRLLEPLRANNSSRANDAPGPIHLIHKVPRPPRRSQHYRRVPMGADSNARMGTHKSTIVCAAECPDANIKEEPQ